MDLPINSIVIFHSYVNVYQRVDITVIIGLVLLGKLEPDTSHKTR